MFNTVHNKLLTHIVAAAPFFFISPCQDVDDDGAAHQERSQRRFRLRVDRHQQHHHGDQAGHGHLPEDGSGQLAVRLQDIERRSRSVEVAVRRGHYLEKNKVDFTCL